MAIARRRFVLFAMFASALVLSGGAVVALTADLYLHHRAGRSAGLNRWGYRGPVVSKKQPGEVRAVMLGGSTVFGYGVRAEESIPAFLEQRLNEMQPRRAWTVVNLGYNTEGAYSFLPNLQSFGYLDYDVVILYEGYNDLFGDEAPNHVTVRQQSPVFRATGYFPILPLWLQEKAQTLRVGNVAAGYDKPEARTVFQPNLADRASASALGAAAVVAASLEQQFRHASPAVDARPQRLSPLGCPAPWVNYCDSVHRAAQFATSLGKRVLIVSQPAMPGGELAIKHRSQRESLAAMVSRQFDSDPRVAYFGVEDRINLLDPDLSFDQMHLGVDGNKIVSAALADPVIKLWSAQ